MNVPHSERLSFALMSAEDADLLFELDQDPAVLKYINGGKPPSMKAIHDIFIPRMQSYTNTEKGWGLWKVTMTKTNEFIGWVLVRPKDFFSDSPEFNNIELGWRFMQKSWGKGYATEAAEAIKSSLTIHEDITHFCAIAVPDNLASIQIMKKLGMTFVKTYLHKDPLGDVEAVYYRMEK